MQGGFEKSSDVLPANKCSANTMVFLGFESAALLLQKPPGSARPPGNPAGLPPGTIAGISVGCAAFAALACGLIMYFIDRRNKRLRLEDKTDAESSASSRRRRVSHINPVACEPTELISVLLH